MYILELNSMASLGKTGSFIRGAEAAGYTYDSLINKMLDVAAIRHFGETSHVGTDPASAHSQPLRTAARSYLRSHANTTVQFLRQITDINTTVRNVENVNRLGKIISRRLAHLGFAEHPHRQFDIGDISYYANHNPQTCLLYTSPSPRDRQKSRMPSSA